MPPPPPPPPPPSLRVYIASCDHASHSHRSPLLLRCGLYLTVSLGISCVRGRDLKKAFFCWASISKERVTPVNLFFFFFFFFFCPVLFFDLVYKSPAAFSSLCLQAFARMEIHNVSIECCCGVGWLVVVVKTGRQTYCVDELSLKFCASFTHLFAEQLLIDFFFFCIPP